MLSVSLSTIESILLFTVGWVIIWWVFVLVHKRFIARDRANVKPFFEDLVYYEYFCPNGHYLGKHEPTLGTLCDVCVEQGHISNPLPIPLPTDNPLPDSLRSQTRGGRDPRQFLEPVQRRIRNLEKVLAGRLQALPALMAQQQRVLRRWKTISLILALLLLFMICGFMSVPSYELFKPATVLSHLPGAMLWAMSLLLYIIICFFPLLYLLTRRKSVSQPVPRQEIRLSLMLAELLVLVVIPLIFHGKINHFAIMMALVYAVVVELIASVIEANANLNLLRKREGYFKDKLEDVRTSSKNIAEAIAFISNWNQQIATPPSEPEPDQAT
jgi:hypothetical protein